ncbi:transketolase [Taibaiella chishuiensis]|uniref:Transketolase n=1 Tax=Taibaiella chishuiensis TaxID=1434707 RepID=A0A2P8D2R4_9BACT|nr:thiamine pyrophosphate-dependent enzyme [Taibaiella chishuiensis]PSK91479.1 transketolase [Taibaiella chishuiensis]
MLFSTEQHRLLEEKAFTVRQHIIRMATGGGCFIGASLSAADLLVYLYSGFLHIDKSSLDHEDRDYLFLSKGHDVPALYGTLAEAGIINRERLQNHLSIDDHIYWHPNTRVSGIEFHSGSLGHLPSVAIGVAMDIKIRQGNNRVICILGDGELNEGTCWEAMLVAQAYKLDNLVFVVDRNQFQANVATEELIPLEPLTDKFAAFGAAVQRINGHDFAAIDKAFSACTPQGKPHVIIADTVRGKGLPSIESRADRWFCNFSGEEIDQLLAELDGSRPALLTSETLVVR